jgi:hypothetical protein
MSCTGEYGALFIDGATHDADKKAKHGSNGCYYDAGKWCL